MDPILKITTIDRKNLKLTSKYFNPHRGKTIARDTLTDNGSGATDFERTYFSSTGERPAKLLQFKNDITNIAMAVKSDNWV